MEAMFQPYRLGNLELANRFVFPPIKTGYGKLGGIVTDRQLIFYRQIARNGPAVIILEPVSVTPEGREHPKQLCVHLSESVAELKKIVNVIHAEKRLACLHLNHAGAAANPMVTGTAPKAPSAVTCPTSEKTSQPLTGEEIDTIITGYTSAARKAKEAGFDLLEIQAGHGYLVSQFLNRKINKRSDRFGEDRLAFAEAVFSAVKKGASDIQLIVRVSGSEMSPEFGIDREDLLPLIQMAEKMDVAAIHVGMGSSCFSPPWYFHHSSLPEKPQMDALAWIRKQTNHPVIVAGRMGRINRKARSGTDAESPKDSGSRRRSGRHERGGLPQSTRSSGNRCGKGTPPRRTICTRLAGTRQTQYAGRVVCVELLHESRRRIGHHGT